MTSRELELFVHLAGTLHFTETSRVCHISPSALSRTIQRLEDELGAALFSRDNRHVALTPAGEEFLDFANQTVNSWNALQERLQPDADELSGSLRIYCSVTASYTILHPLLGAFRQRHPRVHIELVTGSAADALEHVMNERVDAAVLAHPEALPDSLAFRELAETPLQFVMPKVDCVARDLVQRRKVSWAQVPMILPERGLARKRLDAWFRRRRTKPNVYAQVNGNEAILAMVGLGCGVGVVPGLVLETSPVRTDVELLEVSPALEPYTVGLCIAKRRMASAVVEALWHAACVDEQQRS